jgi:MPBQ/MSBQ methyltransferase
VFYAFLAQVYDHIVNPGHWTPSMRSDALAPLKLAPTHRVVDVGAGTGFCTQGVVAAGVPPTAVTMVDQSPHQLAKARRKPDLKGVTILEGDAEAVPLASDAYDRYVSAGSIEYWPDPQMGVAEAYRLALKERGVAGGGEVLGGQAGCQTGGLRHRPGRARSAAGNPAQRRCIRYRS